MSKSFSQGSATTEDFSDRPSITYRWEPRDILGDFIDPGSWEPKKSEKIEMVEPVWGRKSS